MNPNRTASLIALVSLITGIALFGFRSGDDVKFTQEKYSQVKIFTSSQQDFNKMEQAGLFLDHVENIDNYSIAWLSSFEIEKLKKSGVGFQVLIDDWNTYYNSLPK